MKKLVFSVIAVLAISSTAFAEQTKTATTTKKSPAAASVTKTPPSPSAAAQAVLAKLNAALTAATGLSYTSEIDYAVPGPGGVVSKHTSTQVTIEKSGKVSIHVTTNGALQAVINADGSNATVYDAVASKYSTAPSQPGLTGTGQALGSILPLIFNSPTDSGTSLNVALRFAFGFLGNRAVVLTPPPDGTAVYTLSKVIVGSKSLLSAAMTFKSVQYHSGVIAYVVDPTDNSRLYVFSQAIIQPTGPPTVRYKETFTTFKLLTAPADASVYGFTPPVTATFIASAPPVPPTPPQAPIPPAIAPTGPITPPAPGTTTGSPQTAPTVPSTGTGGAPAPPNSPIPVAPGSPAPAKAMPGAPPL